MPDISEITEEQRVQLANMHLVCGDPGKQNLLYLMDPAGKTVDYTRACRYRGSQAKRAAEIRCKIREQSGLAEHERALMAHRSTTVDVRRFAAYLRVKAGVRAATRSEYEQLIWRKLRHRSNIGRQRMDDYFLNRVAQTYGQRTADGELDESQILLVIGNWTAQHAVRGNPSTQCIGLKRLLRRRFPGRVFQVDEFRTSKLCCNCGQETVQVKVTSRTDPEVDSGVRILGCRQCHGQRRRPAPSREHPDPVTAPVAAAPQEEIKEEHLPNAEPSRLISQCKLLNRDVNACVNMLAIATCLLVGQARPARFCRPNQATQQ